MSQSELYDVILIDDRPAGFTCRNVCQAGAPEDCTHRAGCFRRAGRNHQGGRKLSLLAVLVVGPILLRGK